MTTVPQLAHLSTSWTDVGGAHAGDRLACDRLAARYLPTARQYLLAAVRDADAADDLTQEFALKLVRGDFSNARPERGRFRNYLRLVLVNLVTDHFRRQDR